MTRPDLPKLARPTALLQFGLAAPLALPFVEAWSAGDIVDEALYGNMMGEKAGIDISFGTKLSGFSEPVLSSPWVSCKVDVSGDGEGGDARLDAARGEL